MGLVNSTFGLSDQRNAQSVFEKIRKLSQGSLSVYGKWHISLVSRPVSSDWPLQILIITMTKLYAMTVRIVDSLAEGTRHGDKLY